MINKKNYVEIFILISFTVMSIEAQKQQSLIIVDLRSVLSQQTILSVQTCVGLFNRDATVAGAAYTIQDWRDLSWLREIDGIVDPVYTDIDIFLQNCMQARYSDGRALVNGYIRYNFSAQKAIIPNLVTLAAVLDSILLEDKDYLIEINNNMVFDAISEFANLSVAQVTEYMFDKYVTRTTGMAKMNPGLDVHEHPLHPHLNGKSNLGLVDFIVKERLFNFFLGYGCVPFTNDHKLMQKIAQQNPWSKPITVYGYDDTIPIFGGDIFEAETNCVKQHNMGQVASDGCNNLAYFSQKPRINKPLQQNPLRQINYDKQKTYITLILGDGDNLNFMKGARMDWMLERVQRCTQDPQLCFPLAWTISPAALSVAPDWINWYFQQSQKTQNDYFILPPSGHTYSYPGEMPTHVQDQFIQLTEHDCQLLQCSTSVHWEWALTWNEAMNSYFPKYSKNNIVKAFFAINVPYMLPILAFKKNEFYKIFNNKTIVFNQREWRGYNTSQPPLSHKNYLTPQEMINEVNQYDRGTITNIYLTSDGGANLDSFYQLAQGLDKHVQIVSPDQLVDLVYQKEQQKGKQLKDEIDQ